MVIHLKNHGNSSNFHPKKKNLNSSIFNRKLKAPYKINVFKVKLKKTPNTIMSLKRYKILLGITKSIRLA